MTISSSEPARTADTPQQRTRESYQSSGIIDCDVHQSWSSFLDLVEYLPKAWQTYVAQTGLSGPPSTKGRYPNIVGKNGTRHDAQPANGAPAGSDIELLREQVLDSQGVDAAILTGVLHNLSFFPNVDLQVALAQAANLWLVDRWLAPEPRFYGSLVVPMDDPVAAAQEIARHGSDRQIVQILIPAGARMPYGQRFFWPVWRACAEHDLAVGIHFGGTGIVYPPTSVGWPSYYIEWHTNMSQAFQAHLVSFVCEGVFEEYPSLRVTMIEGGVAWLPHVMWRLDQNFRALRSEVPWLKRPPSDYIREHLAVTTQPLEEPAEPSQLVDLIKLAGAEHMILFASDYPHWDADAPHEIARRLPPDLRSKIMFGNAERFYRLSGKSAINE
jgi:uncharacterized protein